ncbi:NAD(P)-binding domain-containing protein [Streptomyces sp. NBC_00053]|uniref:NAD(P)-binding domain-containing protein n=1 Tax=unclassified Streptomyces TaxID=2593676 RepID=UPI000FB4482A|nr:MULTISPECIES: NAD(P)-binding domain-containing protein [unclassified Streptomyces]MCX4394220.1 NAD(P)-binding domain-containing protein [Streptomyces sp. NBC_01767]MCX5162693.1 NAD(P)-binding domain-containing protein [Streptomyces sp. NBC_00305]MCX5221210.1 NAD(P)-binding domain-containing protein [Streptomyces sp. NBC_00264]MCX5502909.1 NAD(P)-binding domain-containing protein [Streptomyces sp. NBC_00052]MCX5548555.1 NAD(P)-binding domain-containing protein [Streptomyces sp. NBC_00051]
MKRIGIIGVGEIGRALVEGLCDAAGPTPEVLLSPRGARTATELSERFDGVRVCADNQQVVDRAELIIIAVRREDRHEALNGLRVDGAKVVVNVMAGVSNDNLRAMLATDAPLVRAIPLPSVRDRRSVTVTYPAHPAVDAFFEQLGGALPVADEAAFDVFSALTGTLTTHYAYLAALTSWAAGHGIPAADAEHYVRGLFQAVGRALGDETRSLRQLAADHETPKGNNERIRTTWFDHTNAATLDSALDGLLTDLRSRQDPSTEPAAEQKTEQEKPQDANAAQRRRPPAKT